MLNLMIMPIEISAKTQMRRQVENIATSDMSFTKILDTEVKNINGKGLAGLARKDR